MIPEAFRADVMLCQDPRMSMLAEPRRKLKWSVDPRNSAWSNDDSKFGQKMLERMGWSKGRGLGRTEQGSTDHIKVTVKNNSYGLGANASHEDNWIAHQDDFNELLAQLNNCHSQNSSSSETPADDQKGFSLEEKSKTSRKRVHYMKFTKGKDLSSRSETDLNCIFGKRSRSTKEPDQDGSSSDSQIDTDGTVTPSTAELDPESIANTVTSSLTMQEYFAQRMAQLKKARGTSAASEEPHQNQNQTNEPQKKKKKRKEKKEAAEEKEVIAEEDQEKQELSKKKKKKRKTAESEDAEGEVCSAPCGVDTNCSELSAEEKKKKKKRNKQNKELLNGHEPAESQTVASEEEQKKKKRRKLREEDREEKEDEQKSKKKKKKKKEKALD